MKKTTIFCAIALGMATMNSCMDGDWDVPSADHLIIGQDSITERNVISIQDLKAKYSSAIDNSSFKEVTEDLQLKGIITCNDEGGNLSQQLVVTDGTSNIIIGITEDAMHSYAKVGQEILLNLKGLYVGGYGKNGQIGSPSMSSTHQSQRIGRMTRQMWYDHVKLVGTPDASKVPAPIPFKSSWTSESDYKTYANTLVYVEGTLSGANGTLKLAEPSQADAGNSVNVTLNITGGGSVTIRTSCYSDFASMVMPTGKVRVYGLLTPYNNNQWQIMMRTADDLVQL